MISDFAITLVLALAAYGACIGLGSFLSAYFTPNSRWWGIAQHLFTASQIVGIGAGLAIIYFGMD